MQQGNGHQEISGHVERVTFHSADSGFAVLQVKVKGERDLVTVVGKTADVHAGEYLTARGEWFLDPTHGRQWKADLIRTTPPDSLEGIERFLGSGLIDGIGPVYAKKLVATFGKEVLEIIESRSARLEEIPGIGPSRRKKIKESWNRNRVVRDIMTFLMSHGISTARAFRIHKTYGEDAMRKVQSDPYCLARDIRGIGFKTADEIARNFGIDANSPLRARAGIEYMLREIAARGHCAYPREDLVREAEETLQIDPERLEEAILKGLADKRLLLETTLGERPLIYLKHMYTAESELAEDLAQLNQGASPISDADPDNVLSWVQESIGIELASKQQEAIHQVLRNKVMVITGGPGVGKTTLVQAILNIFEARKKQVRLAAPTGRAAKRLSESSGKRAVTLHRLLIYDPATGGFKHNRAHPLKGDVFVIDEASMLDLPLAHQFVSALPRHAVLLLVGDVDQLPSVGPGRVLADLIESDRIAVARLTEIFRQAQDSAIITNAHRINQGLLPETCSPSRPGDFYLIPAEEATEVDRKLQGLLHDKLRSRFRLDPRRDVQILTPMQRGALGARNLNDRIQQLLNPRGDHIDRYGTLFRVGDRVMQVLNNYDRDVYNGDMGRIVDIDREESCLWVDIGGDKKSYPFHELDELVLSYAVTIHKSQGSEYPCVVIPLHTQHYMMLQRNLLYTAVTRGKKLVIVIGPAKALQMCVHQTDGRQRYTCLADRMKRL